MFITSFGSKISLIGVVQISLDDHTLNVLGSYALTDSKSIKMLYKVSVIRRIKHFLQQLVHLPIYMGFSHDRTELY